jgi:hypothetical protein
MCSFFLNWEDYRGGKNILSTSMDRELLSSKKRKKNCLDNRGTLRASRNQLIEPSQNSVDGSICFFFFSLQHNIKVGDFS